MREVRKNVEIKENSHAIQNNNSLAIKQSQGPLAPSQGQQIKGYGFCFSGLLWQFWVLRVST